MPRRPGGRPGLPRRGRQTLPARVPRASLLLLLLLPLLLLPPPPARAQNAAIEARTALRNEAFQQAAPAASADEPPAAVDLLQRPPPPVTPEVVRGRETATALLVRWRGAWAPAVDAFPVVAFELQYRKVGDRSWASADYVGDGDRDAAARYHHEIQTVTTRADNGQTIDRGWFRLSMHARGMSDADPESKTQTVRIPYNASAEEFRAALDALDNVRFGGSTKHVTRSETPDAQGGFTWTVSFDVGLLGQLTTTSGYDSSDPGDAQRNWPSLLVTETYFPDVAWTGGGLHVAVATARVGTGDAYSNTNRGFNGDLHDSNAGLAACAHAGNLGTKGGTHAGVDGPSYDMLKMAFPVSYCVLSVVGLDPFTRYQMRVRARNMHGFGPFSDVTDPVGMTRRGSVPLRSRAPALTSAGPYAATVDVRTSPVADADGGEPITGWDFQIRLVSGGGAVGAGAAAEALAKVHARRTADTRLGAQWISILPAQSSGQAQRPIQQDPTAGASITASGLAPMSQYEFRVRARNSLGAGPWSAASAPVATLAGDPRAPSAPIVDTSGGHDTAIGDSSVAIAWSYTFDDTEDPVGRKTSNGAVVTRFEVEKLALANGFHLEWESCGSLTVGSAPSGSVAGATQGLGLADRNEVQVVSTRSDPGTVISDGWFTLGFNHDGRTTTDPEAGVVTARIPFDADGALVKRELEKLSNIGPGGILRVDRNTGLSTSELVEARSAVEIKQAGVGVADAA